MPATDSSTGALAQLVAHRRMLVLTGAGISTDSGIPDYRGPHAPVRMPMTFQDFVSGPRMRRRYWARSHIGWQRMAAAKPNAAHFALVRMQAAGRLSGLITQNVDGLHELAGHRDGIDLHGRIDRVTCLDCHRTSSRLDLHERLSRLNPGFVDRAAPIAPDGDALVEDTGRFRVAACSSCGGMLKPDVVFFGENVPKDRVARCLQLTDETEGLLVLGSSLQVMSGLRFVRRAHKRGIPVVIINRGTTRADDLADILIDAGCAETLVAIAGQDS